MPISVEWYDENKIIILQKFSGRWSWEELHQATIEVTDMMESITSTVHIFADFTEAHGIPKGSAFTQGKGVINKMSDNLGLGIVIGANRFVTVMFNMFKKLFNSEVGRKTFTADSIEEAYELIAQYNAENVSEVD